MRLPRRAALPLLFLLLSGCAAISLVPAGRQEVGVLAIQPEAAWNRMEMMGNSNSQVWTRNGVALDRLMIVQGLAEGGTLPGTARPGQAIPTFRAAMAPEEVAEMVLASFAAQAGASGFELTGIQPASFAGRPGFRFTYRFVGLADVSNDGVAVGAVVGGRLFLVSFSGTRLHHFRVLLPEVDRMIGRAELRAA